MSCGAASRAQAQEPKWELDFHVGGLTGTDTITGTGRLPDPPPPFTIPVGAFAGRAAPRVSTWFFGEGSRLLQALSPTPPASLDPALTTGAATYEGGVGVGVRLGRHLIGKWRAEIAVDYGLGELTLSIDALRQIEATRASFGTGATLFIPSVAAFPLGINTTAAVQHREGRTIASTVVVSRDLLAARTVVPFVQAGIGAVSGVGRHPMVRLEGRYGGTSGLGSQGVSQQDLVTVEYKPANHRLMWSLGTGAKITLAARWLLRFDANTYFVRERLDVSVDASPSTAVPAQGGGSATIFGTNPPVVFSNIAAIPSTLSGPAIENFTTFTGRATQMRFSATAGLGLRF